MLEILCADSASRPARTIIDEMTLLKLREAHQKLFHEVAGPDFGKIDLADKRLRRCAKQALRDLSTQNGARRRDWAYIVAIQIAHNLRDVGIEPTKYFPDGQKFPAATGGVMYRLVRIVFAALGYETADAEALTDLAVREVRKPRKHLRKKRLQSTHFSPRIQ